MDCLIDGFADLLRGRDRGIRGHAWAISGHTWGIRGRSVVAVAPGHDRFAGKLLERFCGTAETTETSSANST